MSVRFECPRWPHCGCPDGTIAPDCPGETIDDDGVFVAGSYMTRDEYVALCAPDDFAPPDEYAENHS